MAEYGSSHKNPTNKAIHWVCVPVIVWTVLALIWSLPVPAVFASVPYLNWMTLLLAVTLVYYGVVSWQLALGFLAYAAACLALVIWYEATFARPLWHVALIVFVIAWIGQFWGHKIEGKKPSFFKDVQFLLIGPAWLLHFLYKCAGIPY